MIIGLVSIFPGGEFALRVALLSHSYQIIKTPRKPTYSHHIQPRRSNDLPAEPPGCNSRPPGGAKKQVCEQVRKLTNDKKKVIFIYLIFFCKTSVSLTLIGPAFCWSVICARGQIAARKSRRQSQCNCVIQTCTYHKQ